MAVKSDFIAGDTYGPTEVNAVAIDVNDGIKSTIIDAKGDLIAGTANNTAIRQALGGNGQVLTANSASSTGLTWATPATSAAAADGRFNIKDYGAVGNGTTNDNTSIQNALNAASAAGGGVVFVPRSTGAYIFTSLNMLSNVTLQGLGGTLKLQDNTTIADLSYFPINIPSRTNVMLIDLIIDGNSANNPGDVVNVVSDLITMVGCSNSTIRNCVIKNAPDSGIMFSRCTNSSIINNLIDNCPDLGIYANDGDGTLFSECLIEGNIILNCDQGGIGLKRITQRVIISNNTIRDCGNGITLEHAAGLDYSTNMTIIGNRMRNIGFNSGSPAGYGINIRGSQYVICSSNHIETVATYGILVESARYSTISSNVVIQGAAQGQAAYCTTERADLGYGCQHIIFVGNFAVGAPTGYWIHGVSGRPSQNITLVGNHAITAGTYGLRVEQYATELTLIGNVFGGVTSDVIINASAGVIYPLNNRMTNGTQSGTFNPPGTFKTLSVATGSRPSATSVGVGTMVYDSTLGKPIWSNGTVWKDAAATTV